MVATLRRGMHNAPRLAPNTGGRLGKYALCVLLLMYCTVLIKENAEKMNRMRHKLPEALILPGTTLQYVIDTELDKWSSAALFKLLCGPQISNPFVAIVRDAQQMAFKLREHSFTKERNKYRSYILYHLNGMQM